MKIGEKLKQIISTVAPTLGAATLGPFGAMAGKALQNALGVDNEAAAMAVIESDPEALVRLKAAELDFEKRMAELGVDVEKIAADDRASARQMATATTLLPQIVLSGLFVLGYFAILGLFFSRTLEVPMSEAFMVMLGVLTAGVPQVMNFWLGSSSGSARKTDALVNR